MKLWRRRAVYISFFVIFFIGAPILIFYTAGYKFNFKNFKVEKTGILVLETKPKDAKIYINDNLVEYTTPAQINNFLPNFYHIKLQKEGYHSWQKTLKLESNLTTFAKGIILFKQSLPILKTSGDIVDIKYLSGKDSVLYLLKDQERYELRLLNLNSENDQLVYKFLAGENINFKNIKTSSNQNKILVNINTSIPKILVININTLESSDLFELTKTSYELIRWSDTGDGVIYGYNAGILYQIDLVTNIVSRILAAQINDFKIENLYAYYISPDNLITKINTINSDEIESVKLPANSNFSFDLEPSDYLSLIDKQSGELIILDDNVFETEDNVLDSIIMQADTFNTVWTKESKNLLHYTDFELWVYNFDSSENTLLNRMSKDVLNAFWYTDNKYVVYQTNNEIKITELDSRDKRNDTVLTKMENIYDSFLSDDGEKVYFSGVLGNQQGIFELQIR
ncbi:PEGA domain-containing protein [Patescibacteria group bacterium]|nr:PEGA domain-containing protein [Patescibacteria group bacterium]